MTTNAGPDSRGSNNLFLVEPRGWFAMMSIHAPASRPKLVDCDPIELNWERWINQLVDAPVMVSCLEGIIAWLMPDDTCEFNQYANLMMSGLSVNNPVRPHGNAVFTAYNPVLDETSGLNADQFATLAAAYRRAAHYISPRMYGADVDV